MGLYWVYECWEFLTAPKSNESWAGLVFVTLIYTAIAWYWVREIRKQVRERQKGESTPPPLAVEEVEEGMSEEEAFHRMEEYERDDYRGKYGYDPYEEDDYIDYSDDDMREDYFDNFPIDRKEDWD